MNNNQVEQTATKLENALINHDANKVDNILSQEAFKAMYSGDQSQFDAVCKRFQEKNKEDCAKNGLLPKVELHESGGVLGFGAHVDDVKVKTADGTVCDMYTPLNQQQPLEQKFSQQQPKTWAESWKQLSEQECDQQIQGIQPQQQPETIHTDMFRGLQNMFGAFSKKGFTSKIQSGDSNQVKVGPHGNQLPPAGFGAWRNQE